MFDRRALSNAGMPCSECPALDSLGVFPNLKNFFANDFITLTALSILNHDKMKHLVYLYARRGMRPLLVALLALILFGPKLCFGQFYGSAGPVGGFDGYVTTGGCWSPLSGNAVRTVTDLRVNGVVGGIPLTFTRIHNTQTQGAGLLGPRPSLGNWACNWDYSFYDSGLTCGVTLPGGQNFGGFDRVQNKWTTIPGSNGIRYFLVARTLAKVLLPDGTTLLFSYNTQGSPLESNQYNLQQLIDPYGQVYSVQITSTTTGTFPNYIITTDGVITEPAGRWLKIHSVSTPGGVTKVTASDGQVVDYSYVPNTTELQTVKYQDGSTATETYDDDTELTESYEPRFAGPMKDIYYTYVPFNTYNVSGILATEQAAQGAVSTRTITQASSTSPIITETRPDGSTRTFYGNSSGLVTQVTDFAGNNQYFTYNGNNQIVTATDGNGYQTTEHREAVMGAITQIDRAGQTIASYTYTSNQFPYYLASSTDANGNTKVFTRDSSNRIVQTNYPDGGVESFSYNGFGEITSHTLTNGGSWTYTYDTAGRKLSQTNPLGNKTDFTYDSRDRIATIYEEARQLTTSFQYNPWDQITQVTHADRTTTSYTYDEFGDKLAATNELGKTWTWSYDQYCRVSAASDPLETNYTYNSAISVRLAGLLRIALQTQLRPLSANRSVIDTMKISISLARSSVLVKLLASPLIPTTALEMS